MIIKSVGLIIIAFSLAVVLDVSSLRARDFPLSSCKGPNGTITKLSGVNTDHASMVGIITEPDFIEYCVRQLINETIERCLREHFDRKKAARHRATANCPKHLLESKTEQLPESKREQYRLVREHGENAWETVRTGKVLGNSCADGTPPLFEQFKILCPHEAESLNFTSY